MAARGVTKSFGGARALDGFDFSVDRGEVHALVGANGSGKSTFIKVLAGVHQADEGTLLLPGGERDLRSQSSADAEDASLRFVHQDLGVFPGLSIAENLAIGGRYTMGRGRRIKWRQTAHTARATLEDFHVDADPEMRAGLLSVPQQALLAIARSLHGIDDQQGAVLILDEPTASLPYDEAQLLFEVVKTLADRGHAVVFVTHRLDEVRAIADRVTGIRDGKAVGTSVSSTMSEADLVELILGRRLPTATSDGPRKGVRGGAKPVLAGRGLRGGPVRGVDIEVRAGEILGIAGLLGSGRTELLKLVFGALPLEAGELEIMGAAVKDITPRRASDLGVAFVPEDRPGEAVIPNHDINVNMSVGREGKYFRRGWLRARELETDVARDIGRYTVKAQSARLPIQALSGGNQQKVVLARWLRNEPRLILLDEPTQGIDVGAREDIFRLLLDAARRGAGIVVVSSEFEELSRLCDRVVVLREGRIIRMHPGGTSGHELLESVLDRGEEAGR